MLGGVQDASKIPELRKRFFFMLGMLFIYRIGVFVPTPGIDAEKLKRIFEQASNSLFGIVNMFSGGALEHFSVLALGIMPYISVSIIVQILTYTIKSLEELQKEGERGRRIITRYTRFGTIVLALIQATAISISLETQGVVVDPGWWFRFQTAVTLTTGTAFIMWLAEQITERGIGNGMSVIVMAGIVARMPATLIQTFRLMETGEVDAISILTILAFAALSVYFIIFVERGQRKIPVQYPRRAVGRTMTQATTQHLPLKVNTSGVMPPIFASSVLGFLGTIAGLSSGGLLGELKTIITPRTLPYEIIFIVLVMFFSFFYTSLVFDPDKIAESLKKNGGFIPSVRPGKDTANYLEGVLSRLTLWGGIYICIICLVPTLVYFKLGAAAFSYFFGGTAVLIVVGVMLDTITQIQSHMVARNYEGFLSKGPGKIRGAMGRASQSRGRLIQR